MILLIDAGNTRIKWALADPTGVLGQWATSGSVAQGQLALLEEAWRGLRATSALVSNVAGPAVHLALQQAWSRSLGALGAPLDNFVSQQAAGGVSNAYRQPQQLGSDRFASAIGAHALFPATSLIVATCGTATTVDAVTADGLFAGGMILPGLRLMASSLARNTAQLPEVLQQSERLTPFADNTEEAIISGCIAAQAGAIERAVATHERMNPDQAARLIMSGGAAALIAPHLAIPHTTVDNLVLIGLQTFIQQRPTLTC
jgi:type III pantothenate kinase